MFVVADTNSQEISSNLATGPSYNPSQSQNQTYALKKNEDIACCTGEETSRLHLTRKTYLKGPVAIEWYKPFICAEGTIEQTLAWLEREHLGTTRGC